MPGATLIKQCEVPTPDGQTSKDPVNRVAPGTLGTGLNPLLEREASTTRARSVTSLVYEEQSDLILLASGKA